MEFGLVRESGARPARACIKGGGGPQPGLLRMRLLPAARRRYRFGPHRTADEHKATDISRTSAPVRSWSSNLSLYCGSHWCFAGAMWPGPRFAVLPRLGGRGSQRGVLELSKSKRLLAVRGC